ncbi:peptidase M24 [Pyrrhoderma noxium]|uniref:Peptidase M24 n=1 Tax=Pyrrhoderma noxium TaxID=2282107 RepID=A0A286UM09_9AGAM|nr:peptidase M24 [Pyrrhoderma noxium]
MFRSIARPSLLRSSLRYKHITLRRHASELSVANFSKPSPFGQPFFPSHPDLVKQNEVTPGIALSEYKSRRRRLIDSLPESSIVISTAGTVKYMSGEIFYKFRQASDFWYLTGCQEQESAIIIEKTGSSHRTTLFCRGKDAAREQWEGSRTDFEAAASVFGVDEVKSIDQLPSSMKALISNHTYVYADSSSSSRRSRHRNMLQLLSNPADQSDYEKIIGSLPQTRRRSLAPEVGKMRSIKSEAEQLIMRQAAKISGRAHAKTMRFAQPGMSEYALAAHFEYACALDGSQRPAYVPVVASGANALIIHYTSNDQRIRDNELVLIDAGCEYNGYASDITRTFPANGKFTPAQHDLYSAVLSAQKELINQCTEDKQLSLDALHRNSCTLLRRELNQLGFRLSSGELERILYPHYLSHPVGIDLHESQFFSRGEPIKEGMVITIEPGIYVPPSSQFPKHFHNIGIRIEDEVLVKRNFPIVLSIEAPKEISDIEGACQGLLEQSKI